MPGTNAGTGQPLWFRCGACRKSTRSRTGGPFRVTLTGKSKAAPHGNAGGRNSARCRQYKCDDCGHVGFSRHIDLQKKSQKEKEGQTCECKEPQVWSWRGPICQRCDCEVEGATEVVRVSGDQLCQICKEKYRTHPLDEDERSGIDGLPYLRIGCDGTRLKL